MLSTPILLAKRLIPDRLKPLLRARREGGSWRLKTEDRILLEDRIIPHFAGMGSVRSVLDVGCDWYTARYPALFPDQDYVSIDIRPEQARFAKGRHLTASLLDLRDTFEPLTFDLVMANGVFGWGVNGSEDIGRAMGEIGRVLRPGGFLIVGWNDIPERRPEPIDAISDAPWLEPYAIPEFGGPVIETDTGYRHCFHLFRRPD